MRRSMLAAGTKLGSCLDQAPVWLDLIAARFPVEPPVAAQMKQRIMAEGARWVRGGERR
jgi:hypothetical protein